MAGSNGRVSSDAEGQQMLFHPNLAVLPYEVDENGEVARGTLRRTMYLDGNELLAAIREIVREEVQRARE